MDGANRSTIRLFQEIIMPLVISDEALHEAGLSERTALVEFACRLFDAGMLTLWSAAKAAGLSRGEFEHELFRRKIPVYRPGPDDLSDDLVSLDRLGA
jgi:predicted HTH domain antitoxin